MAVVRYRCQSCEQEQRALREILGVEPGRICGSLARLLTLLAAVALYELALTVSAMGVWRVAQRFWC